MPIPFLVAGLAAVATAVVAAVALSDDEKSSSSGRSSDSDEAERRRKETAGKERKERERIEKREAASEDFQKQGRAFGKSLVQTLPSDLVQASLRQSASLDFDLKKGSMTFNADEALQRDAGLAATIATLNNILSKRASHQKTTDNLVTFSELYKPTFHCGVDLKKYEKRMVLLDHDIDQLRGIKHQLMKLENELTSTRA